MVRERLWRCRPAARAANDRAQTAFGNHRLVSREHERHVLTDGPLLHLLDQGPQLVVTVGEGAGVIAAMTPQRIGETGRADSPIFGPR